jgi:hypothetical protein
MTKEPQSKDEALEALDFIVNVLKEHERDLDRLISELGSVMGQMGGAGGLGGKVEKIEQKLTGLQNEITSLVNYLSASSREVPLAVKEQKIEAPAAVRSEIAAPVAMQGARVILKCRQWADFQNLAFQAQTLSFITKEAEKTFQVYAVKGNQVVTYSGELPKLTALLKMWLSKQLDVSEQKILEGILTIG